MIWDLNFERTVRFLIIHFSECYISCASGAAEADAGILVINATCGEFETGFGQGGQTREHAVLLRSLGKLLLCCTTDFVGLSFTEM